MKKLSLQYHKISQKQVVDSAMIIFHGYGDSMAGFEGFADFLSKSFPNMAFYLTNAPDALMFGGYSWFDLSQDDFIAFENPEIAEQALNGLIKKAPFDKVHKFTQEVAEIEGIDFSKICYAGFSQGGMMSLVGGLTFGEKLGGVVAMSAVPLTFEPYFTMDEVKNSPEVLLTHGTGDSVVPFVCFEMSKQNLKKIGITPETCVVKNADHNESITYDVLQKIIEFLKNQSF